MHCFPRFQLKSRACRMAIKWNSSLFWRVFLNVRSARGRVHCAQLRSGCFRSKDRPEVTSNDLFSLASNRNVRWLGSWHDEASQQLLTNGSPSTEEINCFIDDNALAYRWTRLFREKRSNTLASPFPRRIHPLEYSTYGMPIITLFFIRVSSTLAYFPHCTAHSDLGQTAIPANKKSLPSSTNRHRQSSPCQLSWDRNRTTRKFHLRVRGGLHRFPGFSRIVETMIAEKQVEIEV